MVFRAFFLHLLAHAPKNVTYGEPGAKKEAKRCQIVKKNSPLLGSFSALREHSFLTVFCVSLWEAVLRNSAGFGLQLEVILGAFCITLAIVKTVVLLRETSIRHLCGGPGGQLFARPLFGGARAALLSIFGSIRGPIGSPFGHILLHFGVLIFSPISEQKV